MMTRKRFEEIKAYMAVPVPYEDMGKALVPLSQFMRELVAHAEETIPPVPSEPRVPKVGEVWIDPARRHGYGGGKFEASEYAIAHMDYSKWEYVCDKPHADGDYSYLCNWSECRCHQ